MSKNRHPRRPPNSRLPNKSNFSRHRSLRAFQRRKPLSDYYYLFSLQILRILYLEACLGIPLLRMAVTKSQVGTKTMTKTPLSLESHCASRMARIAGLSSEKASYSIKFLHQRSRKEGGNGEKSLRSTVTVTLTTEVLRFHFL